MGQSDQTSANTTITNNNLVKRKIMNLVLLPDLGEKTLEKHYARAFSESRELYIVSAYLSHWTPQHQLSEDCKRFRFIVGKDFGITRKDACRAVMKWLPKHRQGQFKVTDDIDGFHPKAVFWRTWKDEYFAIVGSSNLSRAAFTSNHEANFFSVIDAEAFKKVRIWIREIEKGSVVVSEDWLEQYVEAVRRIKTSKGKTGNSDAAVVKLPLPKPKSKAKLLNVLTNRREQMSKFAKNKRKLEGLIRTAAVKRTWTQFDNEQFYSTLNELWVFGPGGSRFQGAGWERHGKSSNFAEFSKSFVRVLGTDEFDRDQVVSEEIDRLADLGVSTRGSLFSEMLCQFFPKDYCVWNFPVRKWLQTVGFKAPARATEGVKYCDLSIKLRLALKREPTYPAKNLAELDAAIWFASDER